MRHDRAAKSSRRDVVMEATKKLLAERGLQRWADGPEDRLALHAVIHQACVQQLKRRGNGSGFEVEA